MKALLAKKKLTSVAYTLFTLDQLTKVKVSPPSAETDREGANKRNKSKDLAFDNSQLPKDFSQHISPHKDFDFENSKKRDENTNYLNNGVRNFEIQIENMDHKGDFFQREKVPTEVFFVEKRYCTVCNIEQPFRSKHCKDCDRCVAKYDHHCPWLGNLYFYD